MARLMLMPTPLPATAAGRSRRGTNCGTIDCQAGAVRAAPMLRRKVQSSKRKGVMISSLTSTALAAATIVTEISA